MLFVTNRPPLGASVREDANSLPVLWGLAPGAFPLTFVTVLVAIGLLPSCPATMCDRAPSARNHGAITPPAARRSLSSSRMRVLIVPRDVRDRMAEIMRSAPAANVVSQGGASQHLSPDGSVAADDVQFVGSVRSGVPTPPPASPPGGVGSPGVTSLVESPVFLGAYSGDGLPRHVLLALPSHRASGSNALPDGSACPICTEPMAGEWVTTLKCGQAFCTFHARNHREADCLEFCNPENKDDPLLWRMDGNGTPRFRFNSSIAESTNSFIHGLGPCVSKMSRVLNRFVLTTNMLVHNEMILSDKLLHLNPVFRT